MNCNILVAKTKALISFAVTEKLICAFMAYTCLIVLDPEIPFTLPETKGISGTDGANYKVIR